MLRFGTDGVRGLANAELTVELVLALGRAAARTLGGRRAVVGRDTRRSGPLLEAALTAGLAAEGVDVDRVGVVPTPAVAWLADQQHAIGAVVSASHNPYEDNGVKLFAPGGRKLDDDTEAQLEALLGALLAGTRRPEPRPGLGVGAVHDRADATDRYIDHLVATVGPDALAGLRLVVDCAHGAASVVGPRALRRAGAAVTVMHAEPDGCNINAASGSTDTRALQAAVVAAGADAGLAFDGDADRVLAVDHTGALVDGDHLLALCALDRQERGVLPRSAVVVTVMANLGLRRALGGRGIEVIETPVGDRHVLHALEAHGLSLGGEQSGHLVFRDLATTGDGILTGLQVLDVVRRRSRPLAQVAAEAMTRLPQVLRNVPVPGRSAYEAAARLGPAAAAVQAELGDQGRVLVRPSGTEPLVRIMVEAPTEAQAEQAAARLAGTLSGDGAP